MGMHDPRETVGLPTAAGVCARPSGAPMKHSDIRGIRRIRPANDVGRVCRTNGVGQNPTCRKDTDESHPLRAR